MRGLCRGVGKDRRRIRAVFPTWVYQDVPLERPHGAERKVTFGTLVFCAVRSSAPSWRPIGAPLRTLLVPRGLYSLAPFPDRKVSTKSGQTQLHLGSGDWPILFLYFGNFGPKQSHVGKVTFGSGRSIAQKRCRGCHLSSRERVKWQYRCTTRPHQSSLFMRHSQRTDDSSNHRNPVLTLVPVTFVSWSFVVSHFDII